MSEVQTVFIQVAPAGRDGPHPQGVVSQGCFVVSDGILTMTDRDGRTIVDDNGQRYIHKLEPGEDPRRIAQRLTRQIRKAFRGGSQASDFYRKLSFPDLGIV